MQRRRCTHVPPIRKQSSQPSLDGVTSTTLSRCVQVSAIVASGRSFERRAVPSRGGGGRLVRTVQEIEQRGVGVRCRAYELVRKDELAEALVPARTGR